MLVAASPTDSFFTTQTAQPLKQRIFQADPQEQTLQWNYAETSLG